ncbi:MAG: S-methyl-5'-thioinosine phosphorylase [Gammaproteobacteria bacterium]|nr:S-methyl-5'-thioinosine phosphorylase [Gammaproteobacteria bacterium]
MVAERPLLGILGGSGLERIGALEAATLHPVATPWGSPSAAPCVARLDEVMLAFIPRHGKDHELPPHRINYRANLAALQSLGVRVVIGLNAVGGIASWMRPGRLALPDQLIDYTWGRTQSFWDDAGAMRHVEFTEPMDASLRAELLAAAQAMDQPAAPRGTYGVTQGPRLETRAEIERLARDGCDMVGMTLMPEAALARELDLAYACIALSVNWAAGRGRQALHEEMQAHMQTSADAALVLLRRALPGLAALASRL